jgi:hypothetical protein
MSLEGRMPIMTPELRQAIAEARDCPVHLADPDTKERFVIIRAEEYERIMAISEGRAVNEMFPFMTETFREGWDDPEMDLYNDLDPRKP